MGEDEYDPPIILGRPFLSIVKAITYIGTREVHMHFPSEKVYRYFTDPNYIVEDSKQARTRRRQCNRNHRRQIIKDGWAGYEGEVVTPEVIQLEQNYPEDTCRGYQWGTRTDDHVGIIHTQFAASYSTLCPVTRMVIDGRSLEDGKGVERIDQGSSTGHRRIRK